MCKMDRDTNSIDLCDEVLASAAAAATAMGTTIEQLEADQRDKVLDRLYNEAALDVHGDEGDR